MIIAKTVDKLTRHMLGVSCAATIAADQEFVTVPETANDRLRDLLDHIRRLFNRLFQNGLM